MGDQRKLGTIENGKLESGKLENGKLENGKLEKFKPQEWEGNRIFSSFFLPLEGGVECYLANLNRAIKAAGGLPMLINNSRQIGNICTQCKYENSNVTQLMVMPRCVILPTAEEK